MNFLKDVYQDIDPVMLQLPEGSVTSSLYCSAAEGLEAGVSSLVESFLVEVYRCKACQFTSSAKTTISTHVAHRHNLTSLFCLEKEDTSSSDLGLSVGDGNVDLQYGLDAVMHPGSKVGEDHMNDMGLERMPFLLPMYGIQQNVSPRSCDMGLGPTSEDSLQVAQTCEVTTLFEDEPAGDSEEETVFHLQDSSTDLPDPLSCQINLDANDEEMAQSAHLMTLGLCRISSNKILPAPPSSISDRRPNKSTALPEPSFLEATGRQKRPAKGTGKLSCMLCQVALPTRNLLDVHLKCHASGQDFQCPHCGWEAQEWPDMHTHWKGHAKKERARLHKCGVCRRKFQSARSRDVHKKKHKRCQRAQSMLRYSNTECDLHKQQQHHHQGGFKCLHCDFTDKTWKIVHKHILTNCKNIERTQEDVEPEAQSALNLNSQIQGKFRAVPYQECIRGVESRGWCHSKKSSSQKLHTRRGRGHEEREEPLLEEASSFKTTSVGWKEFCCTLCDRKFSSRLTMRRHMGIHQGDKPFECPHCHYRTRLKASLIQHLRVHTGEKPFKCSQCPYASIDRSSLRRHSRTHTQEKPYRCQYCPYSSIQKKSLDLHSRRHHTGEWFPCPLCPYTSPDRQLLLRHTNKHHGPGVAPGSRARAATSLSGRSGEARGRPKKRTGD
ncbi:oocyte zinc finger protein XlCOF6 [Denticeps clupeoides]|nr:oocyte zinc finger protein XlCOF6-like [Denticeps clupeoides]